MDRSGQGQLEAGLRDRRHRRLQQGQPNHQLHSAGLGTVDAKPRFHVREVPLGQQHFIIRAQKAVLMEKSHALTGGSAGAGKQLINGTNVPGHLMTGGFDVRDVHMITAWEALVAMTSAYVDEKYWKIS